MDMIAQIEAEQIASLSKSIPDFKAGDTIKVGYKVTEALDRVYKIMKACALPEKMVTVSRVSLPLEKYHLVKVWKGYFLFIQLILRV